MIDTITGDVLLAFKATRTDGTDLRTGTVRYEVGATVEIAPTFRGECGCVRAHRGPCPRTKVCGVGLHLSADPITALRQSGGVPRDAKPVRFFACAVERADVIAHDDHKMRVRLLLVVEELSHAEVFGGDITERVARVRAEIETWKAIPWLAPPRTVSDEDVIALVEKWRERMAPYVPAWRGALPSAVRLCRTREEAKAAADAAAADAADAVAADAAADAADADAAAAILPGYWWYTRPWYVLRRHARALLAGWPEERSPFAPMVALYRLGCCPIGYVRGEFVVWVPAVATSGKGESNA